MLLFGTASLDNNIFAEGLKLYTVDLFNGDCYVTSFARMNISHSTGFTGMSSADNSAQIAVYYFACWLRFHVYRFHY